MSDSVVERLCLMENVGDAECWYLMVNVAGGWYLIVYNNNSNNNNSLDMYSAFLGIQSALNCMVNKANE